MDPNQNRPRAREKNVTGSGSVHVHGEGLGSGPVGSSDGYARRKPGAGSSGHIGSSGGSGGSGGGFGTRAAIGGGGILMLVLGFLATKLFGGSGGGTGLSITDMLGGGADIPFQQEQQAEAPQQYTPSAQSYDNTVASGSRAKYTQMLGSGKDTVTVMLYVCGTDLESKSGMASADLSEIAAASYGDNVNIIVYTGGCKKWKTGGISTSVNQIYRVRNGKLEILEQDMGNKVMTKPDTLSEFIRYCAQKYPASRNELIFWDHGGGSVSGYGYDEKASSAGGMDLAGINQALKNGGVKFDFVGFDACLMATAETALMLNQHADYMIASEETEPGIGWYYTNWVTKLGQNTSMPTAEVGKNIVDDFISACDQRCPGQKTTLSVIDLAEFSNTVPADLNAFAQSVSTLLTNKDYETVSQARYGAREFAASSKIDQVDLVNLALNLNNSEGKKLAESIKGAVKYNRTSSSMTNAYGVSIYFPYKRTSYVDSACKTYDQINMDSSYAKCIKQFASLETSGQISAGGSEASSPLGSLLGSFTGGSGSSGGSSDLISSLLGGFLGGGRSSIAGLDSSNTAFMDENPLSLDETAQYLSQHYFDGKALVWNKEDGKNTISLAEDQWKLVQRIDRNVFFDNGNGYADLGLDNVYQFDDQKRLVADTEPTAMAINNQIVAYYHTDTTEVDADHWTISGYVPALLNGERVKLIVVYDQDHRTGYVAGAESDYHDGETQTAAKAIDSIQAGDKLQFLCDFYSYSGEYQDTYYLGNELTAGDSLTVSDLEIDNGPVKITYVFTDIFNQEHWTDAVSE